MCQAAAAKAADILGCSELKQEQMQVVTAVLLGGTSSPYYLLAAERRCVYAVLPAAFDALSAKGLKTCYITGGQLQNTCAKEAVVAAT